MRPNFVCSLCIKRIKLFACVPNCCRLLCCGLNNIHWNCIFRAFKNMNGATMDFSQLKWKRNQKSSKNKASSAASTFTFKVIEYKQNKINSRKEIPILGLEIYQASDKMPFNQLNLIHMKKNFVEFNLFYKKNMFPTPNALHKFRSKGTHSSFLLLFHLII